jgi:23S rRNA (cytosine1962-C5)-methyltransferase
MPKVILKPKRALPFYARHPWVFAGAVASVEGSPEDGAEVDVLSHTGQFVARGLFNSRSKILVRLYSWNPDERLDRSFFRSKLESAIRFRHEVLGLGMSRGACRLVFSEADGLSGMIVDRYADWLAVQYTSLALAQRREMFAELLAELLSPRGIVVRTEKGIGKLESLELKDGPMWGESPPSSVVMEEHGLRFQVNICEGQKTGFYLDQRDNRQMVARLARGRRVLDGFCYTGGFGLFAAQAGATEVVGIDASETAIALARANAIENQIERAKFIQGDVFDELSRLQKANERFDMVILDPPKFARTRHAIPEALRGYRRLKKLGLRLLNPDGIFVMCCCSGLITMDHLIELLAQTASTERRHVQILDRRGAAPDHPLALSCLETGYLKCLITRVV